MNDVLDVKDGILFKHFNKIPRYRNEYVRVTEKIDGSNAQVYFDVGEKLDEANPHCLWEFQAIQTDNNAAWVKMFAGSRNRWITTDSDNYGFAKWALEHKEELWKLGPGRHYGEWWGSGIQRKYGKVNGEKLFSLFRTDWTQFGTVTPPADCCLSVPILWEGPIDKLNANVLIEILAEHGSYAAPGFMDPEGIVINYTMCRQLFKKFVKNDDIHKGEEK